MGKIHHMGPLRTGNINRTQQGRAKMSVYFMAYIDWLMQERHNSIANALELRLSFTNLSIFGTVHGKGWDF